MLGGDILLNRSIGFLLLIPPISLIRFRGRLILTYHYKYEYVYMYATVSINDHHVCSEFCFSLLTSVLTQRS